MASAATPNFTRQPSRKNPLMVELVYDQASLDYIRSPSARGDSAKASEITFPPKPRVPAIPIAAQSPNRRMLQPYPDLRRSTKLVASTKSSELTAPDAISDLTASTKKTLQSVESGKCVGPARAPNVTKATTPTKPVTTFDPSVSVPQGCTTTPEPIDSEFPDCIFTQRFPDMSKLTDVFACDTEFLDWKPDAKRKTLGSITFVNTALEVVYDVGADYGNFGTDKWPVHNVPEHLGMLRKKDLDPANGARPIAEILANIAKICEGRTIVFHSGGSDVRAIGNDVVKWSKVKVLDTSKFPPWFCFASPNCTGMPQPKLRTLARGVLGRDIQKNGHNSKEDAIATMVLYNQEKAAFEAQYASGSVIHDYYLEVANPPKASKSASKSKRARKAKAAKKAREAKTSSTPEEQDSKEDKVDSGTDVGHVIKKSAARTVYLERTLVEIISAHIKAAAALLRDQAAEFRFSADLEKFERRAAKAEASASELSRLAWKLTSVSWQLWHWVEGVDTISQDEKIDLLFDETPLDLQIAAMELSILRHVKHIERYCIVVVKKYPDKMEVLENDMVILSRTRRIIGESGL